jgi:hypothetical protein
MVMIKSEYGKLEVFGPVLVRIFFNRRIAFDFDWYLPARVADRTVSTPE